MSEPLTDTQERSFGGGSLESLDHAFQHDLGTRLGWP
jgi:hypothetical protein